MQQDLLYQVLQYQVHFEKVLLTSSFLLYPFLDILADVAVVDFDDVDDDALGVGLQGLRAVGPAADDS